MRIEKDRFRKFLEPYKDEHIYVDRLSVNREKAEILAVFHRGRYPYSKKLLGYLAGSEAILFVTQLAYIMCGLMLEMDLPEMKGTKLDVFRQKIDEDKVHLTHIDIKFRKKVQKAEEIPVRFTFKSLKRNENSVHVKATFDIDNSFFGSVLAVMLL